MALYTPYSKDPAKPQTSVQAALRTEHDADGTIRIRVRHLHAHTSVTTTVDALSGPTAAHIVEDGQPPHKGTAHVQDAERERRLELAHRDGQPIARLDLTLGEWAQLAQSMFNDLLGHQRRSAAATLPATLLTERSTIRRRIHDALERAATTGETIDCLDVTLDDARDMLDAQGYEYDAGTLLGTEIYDLVVRKGEQVHARLRVRL